MAKSKKKAAAHKAKKPAARKPAKATKKPVKRPSASKAKPKHRRSVRPKAGRVRTSDSPAEIFRDNHKPRRLDPFTKAQKQKLLQLRDAMVDSMAGVAQDTLRSRAEGSEASAAWQSITSLLGLTEEEETPETEEEQPAPGAEKE